MSKYGNFIIFGTGRTGSTLLTDMLNRHPQISCDREILNIGNLKKKPWQNLLRQRAPRLLIALHRLKTLQRSGKQIYGFKLQAKQVQQPEPLLQHLHRRGWLIIWLYRRDLFRWIISFQVAHRTRRYNSNTVQRPQDEPPQLTIQPDQFSRLVHNAVRQHQQHHAMMAQLPHLTLVYEDDLKQHDVQLRTLQQLAATLGVDAGITTVQTSVQPPWRVPYNQIITNYAELQGLYRTLIDEYPEEQLFGLACG